MKSMVTAAAGVLLVAALAGCAKPTGAEAFTAWAQDATIGGTKMTQLMDPSGIDGTGRDACKILGESASFEAAVATVTTRASRFQPTRDEVVALLREAAADLCPERSSMLP